MSDIQDYRSSVCDPASRKYETFSYLPEMGEEEIRKQVDYPDHHVRLIGYDNYKQSQGTAMVIYRGVPGKCK